MELIFSNIQEAVNAWEKTSPEEKEKFIKDYSNKPEVFNKQIERLDGIINALKNATEEDIAFFRENENIFNKYEDMLLNQIYTEDNRLKITLQRYFTAIDELVTDKINSADSSSQDTPQTPQPTTTPVPAATGSTTPTRDLSEKLTPEDNAKLIKKLEEMGFEL